MLGTALFLEHRHCTLRVDSPGTRPVKGVGWGWAGEGGA